MTLRRLQATEDAMGRTVTHEELEDIAPVAYKAGLYEGLSPELTACWAMCEECGELTVIKAGRVPSINVRRCPRTQGCKGKRRWRLEYSDQRRRDNE